MDCRCISCSITPYSQGCRVHRGTESPLWSRASRSNEVSRCHHCHLGDPGRCSFLTWHGQLVHGCMACVSRDRNGLAWHRSPLLPGDKTRPRDERDRWDTGGSLIACARRTLVKYKNPRPDASRPQVLPPLPRHGPQRRGLRAP